MTSIPPGLSRAPNLLMSRNALSTINRTSVGLYRVQQQISTGQRISRPGEDPVAAATLSVLDARLERSSQLLRNMQHAAASLATIDTALSEASDLVNEARQIASEQVNSTASAEERAAQATIVDSLLRQLFTLSNRSGVQGHIFAGSTPGSAPVTEFFGAYRYTGSGPGLVTDIRLGSTAPLTLGNPGAIGATSARHNGFVDLAPTLTGSTRLRDADGARGLGISTGAITMRFDGGPAATIDLSHAQTFNDVAHSITAAIRQYESDNSTTILGPGGVSFSGESLSFDIVGGTPDPTLTFSDIASGITARDLGLASDTAPITFDVGSADGASVSPRATWSTPLSALAGLDITGSGPLGSIRVTNAGRTAEINLADAQTLQDIKNLLETAGLGIRVAINQSGTGIDIHNEVSGSRAGALSITDTDPTNQSALRLGIRTFSGATLASQLNDGRGVRIVHNRTDPITGLPDSSLDVDFRIGLGDADGTLIDIDLRPQDLTTIDAILARINAQLDAGATAAGHAPGTIRASLSPTANGIVIERTGTFPDPIRLERANNSNALEDLGLLNTTIATDGSSTLGRDVAAVRVDSLFTALIDLREALATNSTSGIAIAGENLQRFVDRVAQERAVVGGYARRIDLEVVYEEGRRTVDQTTRSQLLDTDYAEAVTRMTLLQTQLNAGLQSTVAATSRTLLDFLG
ncbi:MAG: hypothetical protein KIT19_02780 [Phycisphaeraceae bacterium]|nr:hypothetical protein [Phycisphaeraceae bacterium]